MTEADTRIRVLQWLEQCVVGLSLCPYARAPIAAGQLRLTECQSTTAADLIEKVLEQAKELEALTGDIETTLIIAPVGFEDFLRFHHITADVEDALADTGLDQDFQLASFHPDYLFAEEEGDDPAHFTNRAPYPIVQLLRVSTVARAVESGDTLAIPVRNCAQLRAMSPARLRELFPWSAHWIRSVD